MRPPDSPDCFRRYEELSAACGAVLKLLVPDMSTPMIRETCSKQRTDSDRKQNGLPQIPTVFETANEGNLAPEEIFVRLPSSAI